MMIPFERARARILREAKPLAPRQVLLGQCRELALAKTIVSPFDLPPYDTAGVAGFALRAEDLAQASPLFPVALRVAGEAPSRPGRAAPLAAGKALRIEPGWPMPAGADAVVREDEARESSRNRVEFLAAVARGENVQPAGSDVARGAKVYAAGHLFHPLDLGLLATLGLTSVMVHPRPRIGLAYVGDDRVLPGERAVKTKRYDGNLLTLTAALEEEGLAPVVLGIWPPDEREIARAFRRHVGSLEMIITSGGVSAREDAPLGEAIERAEGRIIFRGVKMDPGRATLFARLGKCLILGLPGDVAGLLAGTALFAFPALVRLRGRRSSAAALEEATLTAPVKERQVDLSAIPGKARAARDGSLEVSPHRAEHGYTLGELRGANCFLLVPPGERPLSAGDRVEIAWMGRENRA